MAPLRALQLPPAPKLDFLHLRYRPALRPLAARWQRPVPLGREPDARAPVPGLLVRDFSHEGDLTAWLTRCRRPAELPAGAGSKPLPLLLNGKLSPTVEAFCGCGVFWPE